MPQLAAAGYTAQISSRGAALRSLKHGERHLITSWPAEGPVPYFAGTILAPWPNRVGGARYPFGGRVHQLTVSEPERGHALHGLVSDVEWRIVELLEAEDHHAFVRLAHTITPAAGYPFTLALTVTHRLDERGLTTTVAARNEGGDAAPYGCAAHPWLLGDDLSLPASKVLTTDEVLLPRSLEDVSGSPYDFREARPLDGHVVDHAFTGLSAGEARVGGVRMTWDPAVLPWVQVCTGRQLDYEGVAVEPMTCPPDAFNSGTDVVVLEPGGEHEASWTISAA
ncbi:aldose 1-epimerase family protein [Nonomuraea rhizosphaerae]|uniref:aldose 1-epimerase family protein n=1 Tax=Nonomuraea rhizosphaerae TaxID=2665663 RepID=UPI001C5FB2C8|nr:aldose 1-epimerase family protein [Nonomuraea rhizosphaerae]